MRVVELLIDEDEEIVENGGTAIALVSKPAHEVDYFKFSADGQVIELSEEDQDAAFQQFNELGEDNQQFLMKGHIIKSIEEVGPFINVGLLKEKFAANNDASLKKKSIMDQTIDGIKYKVRFKYTNRPGRPATLSTSRKFCKDMMNANKIYRLEDINKINNGFAAKYGKGGPTVSTGDTEFFDNNAEWGNVFFRFGGPNCGHVWVRITYQEIFNAKTKETKYDIDNEQSKDNAALIAGSNMNEKTLANPGPQTVRRAGLAQFAEEQKLKQCLAGPILIPDKLIYRYDQFSKQEYYCYFSKDTTERIAYKYMRDKNQSNINLEHDPNKPLEDITLVESWIVTDPTNDKSNQFGYTLPQGSWFGIVQCKDKGTYDKYVASGVTSGFSLEGFFESRLVKFNNSKIDVDTYILSEIEKLISE